VQKFGHHTAAAISYSWMRPPSRSRRLIRKSSAFVSASTNDGVWGLSGGLRSRARWLPLAAAVLPLFCRSLRCLSWQRLADRNVSGTSSLNVRSSKTNRLPLPALPLFQISRRVRSALALSLARDRREQIVEQLGFVFFDHRQIVRARVDSRK
jgi:hypothetical protein